MCQQASEFTYYYGSPLLNSSFIVANDLRNQSSSTNGEGHFVRNVPSRTPVRRSSVRRTEIPSQLSQQIEEMIRENETDERDLNKKYQFFEVVVPRNRIQDGKKLNNKISTSDCSIMARLKLKISSLRQPK